MPIKFNFYVNPSIKRACLAFCGVLPLIACSHAPIKDAGDKLGQVGHVIVIYAENRKLDHLYGLFPNANGIAQAGEEQTTQIDHDGKALQFLPPIAGKGHIPAINAHLANRPFRLDAPPVNLPASVQSRDLVHRFYQNQEQINGGKNNKFAAISDGGGLAMGYYDGSKLPMWQLAKEFVLADNFFMGAYGGSFLNHLWLICACTPQDPQAPAKLRAQLDSNGHLKRKPQSPRSAMQGPPQFFDGAFTPDGYAVNTRQSPFQPSGIPPSSDGDRRFADPKQLPLPPQTQLTIGDILSDKGITWAWYAGGWNAATLDGMQAADVTRTTIYNESPGSVNFQPHHQPFNYFQQYAPGSRGRMEHLKDGNDFISALHNGDLPQVAFYKPSGNVNEHPGYTDVLSGDPHIFDIIKKIQGSPIWHDSVVIVTYDENGGFWDHASPPPGDRWGPGSRVPALIISPFAKRGFVDHTAYDTTSIIKFISRRFDLPALLGVRANAGDLMNALDFIQ